MLGSWREASGDGSRENLGAGTNPVCCSATVREPSAVLQALGLQGLQRGLIQKDYFSQSKHK